jgi:GDP-L-fucose synthase
MVAGIVGFRGRLKFDTSKPDGTPRKMLDVSRANSLRWRAQIGLREGFVQTYRWFIEMGAGSGQPDPVAIAQEKA